MEVEIKKSVGGIMGYADLIHYVEPEWRGQVRAIHDSLKYPGDPGKCFCAVVNGETVGFIFYYTVQTHLLLPELIYVKPEYRGHGIATELLSCVERLSKASTSIIFYNKELRGHYAKQGYGFGDNLEVAMKELRT